MQLMKMFIFLAVVHSSKFNLDDAIQKSRPLGPALLCKSRFMYFCVSFLSIFDNNTSTGLQIYTKLVSRLFLLHFHGSSV